MYIRKHLSLEVEHTVLGLQTRCSVSRKSFPLSGQYSNSIALWPTPGTSVQAEGHSVPSPLGEAGRGSQGSSRGPDACPEQHVLLNWHSSEAGEKSLWRAASIAVNLSPQDVGSWVGGWPGCGFHKPLFLRSWISFCCSLLLPHRTAQIKRSSGVSTTGGAGTAVCLGLSPLQYQQRLLCWIIPRAKYYSNPKVVQVLHLALDFWNLQRNSGMSNCRSWKGWKEQCIFCVLRTASYLFFCCCCFLCHYGLKLLIYITCVAGRNCRKRGYARSPSTWYVDVKVFPAILVLQLRKLLVLLLFSAAIWGCQLPGKKQCPLACAGPQTHAGQLFKLEKRDYEGDAE